MKLAVVGAGAAGTAAAWCAARAGAGVTVFHGPAGSTELYSGALDRLPWQRGNEVDPVAGVMAFATALSAWSIGARPRRVATEAGLIRPCRGADTALLDLEPLAGKVVRVADAPLLGWDANTLARSLSAQPWAEATGTVFEAQLIDGLVAPDELRLPRFDVAALFDEPRRLDRLAELLESRSADAWLLGPWLGTQPGAGERLRDRLGVPCGEVAVAYDSPAGARFAHARDELFVGLNVESIRRRVLGLEPKDSGVEIALGEDRLVFDAAVLAVGGVAAGGIVLDDTQRPSAPGFRLGLDAPVQLALDDAVRDGFSSTHGVDLQGLGLGALERIGVVVDSVYGVVPPRLYAVGDVVAGRSRTVLEAVSAGIVAAGEAVRVR